MFQHSAEFSHIKGSSESKKKVKLSSMNTGTNAQEAGARKEEYELNNARATIWNRQPHFSIFSLCNAMFPLSLRYFRMLINVLQPVNYTQIKILTFHRCIWQNTMHYPHTHQLSVDYFALILVTFCLILHFCIHLTWTQRPIVIEMCSPACNKMNHEHSTCE